MKDWRFASFSVVGAANTLIHLIVAWALVRGLEVPVLVANAAAFFAANLTSFVANARMTFGVAAPWRRYLRFLWVSLTGLLVSSLFVAGASALGMHYLLAIAAAAVVSAVIGFSLSNRFVFVEGGRTSRTLQPQEEASFARLPRNAELKDWVLKRLVAYPHLGAVGTVLLVLACSVAGYALLGVGLRVVADERVHAEQVWALFIGDYRALDEITMFPAYHAMMALVGRVIGHHNVEVIRFANLLGSLLLPLLVWRLVAMYHPQESPRRTSQWFVMPLLFPFFFLVYTDAWALVAVLAMALFALQGRPVIAAAAASIATLLRQDMIIWVAFAWILVVLGKEDLSHWRRAWRDLLLPSLLRSAPLLAVLTAFAAFVMWNRGVALGERSQHPVGFNVTNVYFMLMCAWVVFLPQNLAALPRILHLLRQPICLILLAAGFMIFMGTFANEHVYNGPRFRFFLRNEALHWLSNYMWIRAIAFVPISWMILTLCVIRLAEPRHYFLYLIAPLAAGLHPLIEQRYYLPALTLLQAWRPTLGGRSEYATLFAYLLITPLVVWGIAYRRFFL